MSAPDEGFDIDPRAFLAPEDEDPGDPQTDPAADGSVSDGSADAQSADAGTADAGIASLERIEEELGEVEHALSRLDEGRYGACQACGAPIDDARLADRPTERHCVQHRETVGGA